MEPSFNPADSANDFQSLEGLANWLQTQLAAGRSVGEVEEAFRLYLLALLYLGNTEEQTEGHLTNLGLEPETANWLVRTTPRRSRSDENGSAAYGMEVMGRPMNLRYGSRDDGHRDSLNDRIERRLSKARLLALGDTPPDPRLNFNEQFSYSEFRGKKMSHDIMSRWVFGFAAAIGFAALAAILWRWCLS